MPRLSVVVVAHREQGFLRPCLTSLLAGTAADLEVVIVDDAATDHSGEIADDVAAGDPRVRVVHLAARLGPGPARAVALERVTGDHVWFVAPTDLVAPDGPARVLARLGADDPDLLVVGHRVRDVYGAEVECRSPTGGAGRVWDLVARTALVRGLAAALHSGAGWEVALAWRLRLAAARVAEEATPAYVRRDLPQAVTAPGESGDAREVVETYERLLAEPVAPELRRALLGDFAVRATALLRRHRSARLFAEVSRVWRAHEGELAALPGGEPLDAAHRRALTSGSHRAWRTVEAAATARRATRRRVRAVARLARHPRRLARLLRAAPAATYYRWERSRPLDPNLVAYSAYWYSAYSCNPRAVYERARTLAPALRGVWVLDAEHLHLVPPGVEHVVAGSRAYYRLLARATYLVNNVNFPNDVVKRPGQIHLQTHHGTPLKTMGMDLVHSPYSRRRMNFARLLRRVARWDYSVSQNVFSSEYWERVYPSGTFRSIETGYPRNDVLALAGQRDVARARAALGLDPDRTSVLYLPTHREYHPGFVAQLDPARVAKGLGPEFVLLMRTHYFYRDAGATGSGSGGSVAGQVVDVADHPRIEDLYLAADVLVTDYSSAMFDYAVLDRPVVIYAPDWEEYRTRRGTTFDLMAEPPGPVATSEDELVEVLASRQAWDDESTRRRQVFRARFCSLEDGTASERVVRALWPAYVEDEHDQ